MVRFTHVLYPTDLSEASLSAFRYAVALARWYGAALTVLHVVPRLDPVTPSDWIGDAQPMFGMPTLENVQAEMARLMPVDQGDGVTLEHVTRVGSSVAAIVDQALSSSADLIVMGTHGRGGFSRFFMGSVAERVVQRAPCPVLTIPPAAPGSTVAEPAFWQVLCPVDFSPASEQALGFAVDLAGQEVGTVTVVNVVEWLAEDGPLGDSDHEVAMLRKQITAQARQRLHALIAGLSHPMGKIEEVVTCGRAHREVIRLAAELKADLIVLGAQGRGGVGLALFGSTTQQVIRAATCPVLVVRAPGAAA